MNIEAILHIPKSNYAYVYKENELHIRLRTAKGDMDQVELIYGVKYGWPKTQKQVMKKVYTDAYFDYYQCNLLLEDSRIGYYFQLSSNGITKIYTEAGFVDEFNDELAHCYYFQYPFINSVDIHRVPSWIHEAIFYSIFVERFYNGNSQISPANVSDWGGKPTPRSFFGGDLYGIVEKLDYLKELGVNGIYLTPIFKSSSNHKYDTDDYFEIDSTFGDKEIFRQLVEKAHERGIKIILDAVLNHCSVNFIPFQDVKKNGKASKYFDWFIIEDDTLLKDPPNYMMFGFVSSMPKFNTGNPELREYLLSAVRYWTENFHIDGWRLDVSDEVDHQFWREFRKVVKNINKDAVIIGENWHDAQPWLKGEQFDSVMNYSVTTLCLNYFAKKLINAKTFEENLSTLLMRYSDQVNEMMLNLLDSHDTERFLYTCKENKEQLMNAATFLYGYKGIPCTYYGTEIGLTGCYDPGCRKCFDWNQDNWDMKLYQYYVKLIKIRKEEMALQNGSVEFESSDTVFAMKRVYENEQIFILINNTEEEQEYVIDLKGYKELRELINDSVWMSSEEAVQVDIPAKSAFYIKLL